MSSKAEHTSPQNMALVYIPEWIKLLIGIALILASFQKNVRDLIELFIPVEDYFAKQILLIFLAVIVCIWLGEFVYRLFIYKWDPSPPRFLKIVSLCALIGLFISLTVMISTAYKLSEPLPQKVEGRLKNALTGEPIKGAKLLIIGPKETVVNKTGPWYSDHEGYYSVINEGKFRSAQLLVSIANEDELRQNSKEPLIYLITLGGEANKEQIIPFENKSMILSHTPLE